MSTIKINTLANELTANAGRQLVSSYIFKLPRVNKIRKFRSLRNNESPRQLRVRYNVPIPFFSGMIDTLLADLNDSLNIRFEESDPADWKIAQKANAAIQKFSPDWDDAFIYAQDECVMTGRGILKLRTSSDDGFSSALTSVPFEDFYFEPKGGGDLENHFFCGQGNIWKTERELLDGAGGIYDRAQVKTLTTMGGSEYKQASYWDNYDYANRFVSLGLTPESVNYVGEKVFNTSEFVLTKNGKRWYVVFDSFSGIWIRFEELKDVSSDNLYPWVSFASHRDHKNFASKAFADDAYPIAMAAGDLFNEDLENRKRRTSNAKLYDKDMIKNVRQLDEAQMGRDRLVEVDTKGGARRLDQAVYAFQTPEVSGTLDAVRMLEEMSGRNLGVSDLQKGAPAPSNKKVGVVYTEMAQISQRLAFQSKPMIKAGEQIGERFFGGLRDYMREPLSIKILGEDGFEWDTIKRIELNTRRPLKLSVVSQSQENKTNEQLREAKMSALQEASQLPPSPNPNINMRLRAEYILRNGGWKDAEIALLLDPSSQADKKTIAETSEAIQSLMLGKVPPINYNATSYFMQRILDFVKTNQGDPKIKKNYQKFLDYILSHEQIAVDNEKRRAQKDSAMVQSPDVQGQTPGAPGMTPIPTQMTPQQMPQPMAQPATQQQ